MKKKYFLLSLLILVTVSISFGQKQFKRYSVESGIIKYKWEGFMKGEQTIYFDKYGYYETSISKTKTTVMGFTTEAEEMTIMHGAEVFSIDLKTKTATRVINPILEENPGADWEEIAEDMVKKMGFKKVGNETILGKNCEVYEGMGKIWIWKGLNLKTETKGMGMDATLTATDVNLGVSIPSKKFEVPSDVKITDGISLDPNGMGNDEEIPEDMGEMMNKLKNMLNTEEDD